MSDQKPTNPQPANTNLSVLSIVLAVVFPLAGLIVSIFANKEIKESQGQKGGANLVRLAFILSIVFLVVETIWISFWVTSYMQALNEINQYQDDMNDILDNMDTPEVCWDPYWEEYTEEACY